MLALFLIPFFAFVYFYLHYQAIVEARIRRPIFNNTARIYAAPELVRVGSHWNPDQIASALRKSGYSGPDSSTQSRVGNYTLTRSGIEIRPGPESFNGPGTARIQISRGEVRSVHGSHGENLSAYPLEPQLVTGLFDAKNRSMRRLLRYDEIPKVVQDAIISVEDRHFFEHGGINYIRLVEGVLTPVFRHRRMQGGSTLTMQMARAFFLSNERSVQRKLAEMMIALQLEHRFTKQQILEMYVNQVDMGQRGSFNILGFGEAAQVYFGKDIRNLTLPEAALLAGLVNGPSYYSPDRHPDRAVTRRNIVLNAMFDNHVISREQLQSAVVTSLKLAPPNPEANGAPYYIDLVREELLSQYSESDLNNRGMRVYTSLDMQLQKAASQAIEVGMKEVDNLIQQHAAKTARQRNGSTPASATVVGLPQVALVVMDPHTGRVLALSGGRNYGLSQLNHAASKRPTGSIFKPFVYATAIAGGLSGDPATAFTQATMIDASEGTFEFNGTAYTPRNFDASESVGQVTARQALAHSINTAAVRVAQMVGYEKVAQLAKAAGIVSVEPTPAMAIGAYDATPLDMAAAYTIFANGGVFTPRQLIQAVRLPDAEPAATAAGAQRELLDPRVAFVMTDMLEAVINEGTATAAVRSKFDRPAAGKTGTSHDAWFAGYTSNLLCVVWVGNDDYSDIKIEGAKAAAPIWTEFMTRAERLPAYRDMVPFTPPDGVTLVRLDKATNLPATSSCPDDYQAYFITSTVPVGTCDHPNGESRNLFQKMFGLGKD
ncbi:MAG: PBP1A family penicillin-binding protein, partial [Acidobacteriaceae bacterium]|nr:PBP1A family penicillin-binding protein [Acidobacteriaceae bacterium]